ncbi:MAG: FecCD family ABC transporter permease [Pirellulaceae bacterium]
MENSRRRALVLCAVGVPICAAVILAAISIGSHPIRFSTTVRILWHHSLAAAGVAGDEAVESNWSRQEAAIVWHVRAPRVLVAVFVGAGLAFAGTIMQGLFRNPLASPGILGVSAGGAFGAVLCLALGWAAHSIWPLPACAFAGSLATMLIVYTLASYQGDTPLATLLLAGIAVAALAGSATSFVIVMSARDDWQVFKEIIFWSLGGLDARRWEHVAMVAAPTGLAVGGSLLFLRELNIMLLGEEQARTLGVDTSRLKLLLLMLASLATGAAVAVSGLIGFVGLLVPHLLRMLVGPDHRVLVPASLLGGAIFLIVTDTVVRSVAPAELRLGIVTGALGAPFFLFLLIQHRNQSVHL